MCNCWACTVIVDVPPEDLEGSTCVVPLACEVTGKTRIYPVPARFRTDDYDLAKDAQGRYVFRYAPPALTEAKRRYEASQKHSTG